MRNRIVFEYFSSVQGGLWTYCFWYLEIFSMWDFASLGVPLLELLIKTSIEPFACLLHQDVTKGWGVPVTIIWIVVGLVSSAGVSAASKPDVGVAWVAMNLLVGDDADPDLEVMCLGVETLPVAVYLQGAVLQQTLPRVASQRCLMVVTTSDQGMERIGRDVDRFEWLVAIVFHSNAHFGEGSGPVSSEFRLLLVEAPSPCFWVVCFLACPIMWIPFKGVLKMIVPISKRSRSMVLKVANPTETESTHCMIRDSWV